MSQSPFEVDWQFEVDGLPSNLDRCNKCGDIRGSHGAQWSCPVNGSRAASAIPLILGCLLTVAGLISTATIGANGRSATGTLSMVALLSGITLLVMGTVLRRRLRPRPGR